MTQAQQLREYERFVGAIFSGAIPPYDFSEKERCVSNNVLYMLNRTQSMFKWSGLPNTIPERNLELMLQCRGFCGFYHVPGVGLYAFTGGLGGEPNPYYMPTIFTIANPALNISSNLKIDEDCIIMPNDSLYIGLLPLFNRYATQMVETELSINVALKNARIISVISADDDTTKKSAEKYLSDIESGKLGIIGSRPFFEGIKVQPTGATSNSNILTNLIEMMQYTKASWYNEIGLNANYNMKRESINSGESQLNNDALLPLVDDMLKNRKIAANKVNEMFGTKISVDFASSWEDNLQEIEAEQNAINDGGESDGGNGEKID